MSINEKVINIFAYLIFFHCTVTNANVSAFVACWHVRCNAEGWSGGSPKVSRTQPTTLWLWVASEIKLDPLPVVCLVGKLDEVYAMLADANPNMVAYRKDDIPEHFHYQHNVRIMPILLEAKEGWTIMQNRTGLFMRTSENPARLFWLFCKLFFFFYFF